MSSKTQAKPNPAAAAVIGPAAAVANTIYNATGLRVRDYPITFDKLIAGMPPPI